LLTFDEVTDKIKLAPFFMAHGVHLCCGDVAEQITTIVVISYV